MTSNETGPKHTYNQLIDVIEAAEPRLRDIWSRRRRDDDFLILADTRRRELLPSIRDWWGLDIVREAEVEAVVRKLCAAFLPFPYPASYIDKLIADGPGPQKAAGRELKGFAAMPGVVPLWLVHRGGHWATDWAPPGSGNFIIRVRADPELEPGPLPEDN